MPKQIGGWFLLLSFSKDLFWFKVLGHGLYFSTKPVFNQREGYTPTLRIGKVYISPLNKKGLTRKKKKIKR